MESATNVPESLGKIIGRLPPVTDQARSKPDETGAAKRKAAQAWASVVSQVGRRYAACGFGSFALAADGAVAKAQAVVVDQLKTYAAEVAGNVKHGGNVILYGPPGTGKDHLLVALMREACKAGMSVVWVNGMKLFERRRDAIDTDIRERDILAEFSGPDVLAISDPVPPWGDLEKGQAEFLFRLIDRRYRDMKPVWVTANVADGKDAEKRIGAQVIDRLRDGGLALECRWPSYRKVAPQRGYEFENE